MKLHHVAIAAALTVASTGSVAAAGNTGSPGGASIPSVPEPLSTEPVWPATDIAERELGDGDETWPENMFVEHVDGKWIVWVLMSPVHGQAKVLNFFSGRIEDAKVENPGEYNDSFVDSRGVTHKSVVNPAFYFKDPRPGGAIGKQVHVNVGSLRFNADLACIPDLKVSQRISSDFKTVVWRKIILYPDSVHSGCPKGIWGSLIGTGLELRDGTMLIAAGKYIFRVREDDLTPVGSAPNLHVVDEADVLRVIEQAKGKDIKSASTYLAEQLHLH